MTMTGILLFLWMQGQNLKLGHLSWLAPGVMVSIVQLVFLIFFASRLHGTMKARSSLMSILEYASEHDVLTGLINRRGFEFALNDALHLAARQRRVLSLLYLDLDGFKQVNDIHSHAVGDHLLSVVAKIWSESVRDGDVLARLGGDEFVLLTHATGAEVETLSERLLSVATASLVAEFPDLRIGVSIGVAEFPRDGKDTGSLLLSADSAMLRAKDSGKSCYKWAYREY
jgi:diguanylate cyclase (GGDEF)-like protein